MPSDNALRISKGETKQNETLQEKFDEDLHRLSAYVFVRPVVCNSQRKVIWRCREWLHKRHLSFE
jgi:hypothetical protein